MASHLRTLLPGLALLLGSAPALATSTATVSIEPIAFDFELVPPEPPHIDGGAGVSAVDVEGSLLPAPHADPAAGPTLFYPLGPDGHGGHGGHDGSEPLLRAFESGIAEHSWHALRRHSARQPGRPTPAPARDVEGARLGGRLEWRWDRFSFSLTGFVAHDDLPYLDPVVGYGPGVDPATGRPRVVGAVAPLPTGSRFGFGSTDPRRDTVANPLARDENPGLSPENALRNPHANQQFFAEICSATAGVVSQLDPSACAFQITPTPTPIPQSRAALDAFASASGGGVDFLNMEASALVQSWPGFEGTVSPGLSLYIGGLWTTTDKALIQPGTVGLDATGSYVSFDGGPVATRYDPATGRTVVLPGARGVVTPDDFAAAGLARDTPAISLIDDGLPTARIEVTLQDSYEPMIDGCPFGASIGGIPVVGRRADGTPVDLGPCGSSAVPDLGPHVRMIDGSQTLFHPLAGCFADPTGADAGVPCGDITTIGAAVGLERDYEAEFLAGLRGTAGPTDRIALPFRSELAAASWNILTYLVVTSCSGDADGRVGTAEREARPDCFSTGELVPGDPTTRREWQPDRCGFAAPHLCRNVRFFMTPSPPGVGAQVGIRIVAGRKRRVPHPRHWAFDVTVLGSELVDVDHLDLGTLRFGPAGARPLHDLARRRDYRWHAGDANGDGYTDLALHFGSRDAGLSREDRVACLAGHLAGLAFASCQEIRVQLYKPRRRARAPRGD